MDITNMVTRKDVKNVREFLNKFTRNTKISIDHDILNAIENMCADYEMRYDM